MFERVIYIRGGIGDFLQCLPFVIKNKDLRCFINTHFDKAEDFFKAFGVDNVKVFHFFDLNGLLHNTNKIKEEVDINFHNISECPRSTFHNIDFPQINVDESVQLMRSFSSDKKIIGIHPFGSKFYSDVHAKHLKVPVKFLSSEFVKQIIKKNNNYLIFGTEEQLINYGLEESQNVKHVKFKNIFSSLQCVKYCELMISVDSCFKTMSSILKIPTLCFINDFEDSYRDEHFITPYCKYGKMEVFRYESEQKNHLEMVDFALHGCRKNYM